MPRPRVRNVLIWSPAAAIVALLLLSAVAAAATGGGDFPRIQGLLAIL